MSTPSVIDEHEQAHRAAYRRVRRIQVLDNTGWLVTACLAAAAVVGVALLAWRRYGHVHNQDVREVEACRAEYAAYRARQFADSFDPTPELVDDPQRARLCARIDRIEASLPWWVRTGT